jgi:beta-lactamase regulating signal transducer with metallopeptidase domain
VGLACLGAALLGATIWGLSIARAVGALSRSSRHIRNCRRAGHETHLPGESAPVWVVEKADPVVMLTGVLHPRLVISQQVVTALSADQLAAVLRHEQAHGLFRDNLKRLLVLLTPEILPFLSVYTALERAWARIVEWAADDRAVAGNPDASLSLAAALVRVARLGTVPATPTLATSLLSDGCDLSERVDRLLRAAPEESGPPRNTSGLLPGMAVLLAGCLVALMLQPATLHSAHEFLEFLIH